MTVDTIGVCPVCGKDILQEPDRKVRGEKYAINKYPKNIIIVKINLNPISPNAFAKSGKIGAPLP